MRLLNTENKLSTVGGILGGGLANWLMGINEGHVGMSTACYI